MAQNTSRQDLIRYDLLVQSALRDVVRHVLSEAAEHGLPGDHHFFIAFRTDHPGTRISESLRADHPGEMTIVLQHQFWDLATTEHGFEVGLFFKGVPERLLVPFEALTGFYDPSVEFGLKFELANVEPADNDVEAPLASANSADSAQKSPASLPAPSATASDQPIEGAEVVSLDAFRKKT
jgi:hypothetical protein